jgi:vacuolar-type H+-ATPase subunit F/Vma7
MPEELRLEKPLVIVGEEDTVMGFQALGFKVYALKGAQEFKTALDEVISEGAAVCLIQESIYRSAQDQINSYRLATLPVFIPFARDAETTLLDSLVKDIRLKATGTF